MDKLKKYIVTLTLDIEGSVLIKAKNRKEAQEKGDKFIDKSIPRWFDFGVQSVEKVKLFNKKYHTCEYSFGDKFFRCICGEKVKV